jgi:hypothetical protein
MDLKMMLLPMKQHLRPQKTSYFKADFDWALKQFKELKSANTQLIANDALEYFLLINDNTVADSTQTALAVFAKGIIYCIKIEMQRQSRSFSPFYKNLRDKEKA